MDINSTQSSVNNLIKQRRVAEYEKMELQRKFSSISGLVFW